MNFCGICIVPFVPDSQCDFLLRDSFQPDFYDVRHSCALLSSRYSPASNVALGDSIEMFQRIMLVVFFFSFFLFWWDSGGSD